MGLHPRRASGAEAAGGRSLLWTLVLGAEAVAPSVATGSCADGPTSTSAVGTAGRAAVAGGQRSESPREPTGLLGPCPEEARPAAGQAGAVLHGLGLGGRAEQPWGPAGTLVIGAEAHVHPAAAKPRPGTELPQDGGGGGGMETGRSSRCYGTACVRVKRQRKHSGKFLSDIKLLIAQKVVGWVWDSSVEEREAGARRVGIPGVLSGFHRREGPHSPPPASNSHLCGLPRPCGSALLGTRWDPPGGHCPGSREALE